jgi:hypothetical protein
MTVDNGGEFVSRAMDPWGTCTRSDSGSLPNFGEIEVMRLLPDKGAEPRVKTADNTTTLMAALSGGGGGAGEQADRRGRYFDKELGEAPDEE